MFWVVFFTVELLAAVCSIVVGSHGVVLPLMQVCAFYFCVKTQPWKATPIVLLFGGLLDAAWLHPFPVQLISLGAVILFTVWWRRFGDLYAWTAVLGASLFCGVSGWLAQWGASYGCNSTWMQCWVSFLGQIIASIVLTFALIFILERVLERRVHPGSRDVVEEE